MEKYLAEGEVALTFTPEFREFGIRVLDGGTSQILIQYCPWCGSRLPESLRYAWFDELEAMGIDEPDDARIPPEYLSEEWWLKKEK